MTSAAVVQSAPAPTVTGLRVFPATILEQLDIRIGTILAVEVIPESKKLYDLTVDVGDPEPRHILVAWRRYYQPEELRGKQLPICCNIEWREMAGRISQGRALTSYLPGGSIPQLMIPAQPTDVGTRVW